MSQTSFSFQFIPEEDRIIISFAKEEGQIPCPILLTRRMVKMLGNYLRCYVEKNTSLPESVSAEDKEDIFQFMHKLQLDSKPPKKESAEASRYKQDPEAPNLVSKVNIQYYQDSVQLKFHKQETHLVSLTLGWSQIHSFLYSLAELSRQADWNLDEVFAWSGRAENLS